jgi:hypothetical protein
MLTYLVKEFDGYNWYPDYKRIKKLLRKSKVPFIVKKQPTDKGLLHSIWANPEHIDQVREIVSSYYQHDPKLRKQAELVEEVSTHFESNWYLYAIAWIYHYGRWRPLIFWPIILVSLGLIMLPVLWYL